jgi:hypothetical protein
MSERPDLYLRALRWQGFSRRFEERTDQELWRDRWAFAPDPNLAGHLWAQLNRRRPSEVSEAEIEAAVDSLYPSGKIASCGTHEPACEKWARARAALALPPR